MDSDHITLQDMLQFADMPYQLSGEIHTFRAKYGHPYTYLELDQKNQSVAIRELESINDILTGARKYIHSMPQWATIQTREIIFSEASPYHGYTKLICTPYTPTGRIAKYPLQLLFMTDLDEENTYTAHGDLYYGEKGKVLKAEVYIWNQTMSNTSRDGLFFFLRTLNGELAISEVKSSLFPDQYGMPGTIYQHKK